MAVLEISLLEQSYMDIHRIIFLKFSEKPPRFPYLLVFWLNLRICSVKFE